MKYIGVPGLTTLSPKSGIGRVIHNLETHLNGQANLTDLIYHRLNLPFIRNFPIKAEDGDLDVVIFPQLTGVRNINILKDIKKSIAIIHDIGVIDCPLDHGLLNPVSKLIVKHDLRNLQRLDAIVSVSNFTKSRLIEYYPNLKDKIHVVHNSLSESFVKYNREKAKSGDIIRNELGIKSGAVVLLYVGTELPRKNFNLLLDTLLELKKLKFSAVLIKLGGSGGARWRQQTIQSIQERNLELEKDIYIRDNINEEQLLNYYNGATATVLPSLYEGFGLPAIESMSLGTPIVAAAGSAMDEIAAEYNMIHMPTVRCFTDALIKIINYNPDSEQRVIAEAVKTKFSAQNQAELLFNLIN